ncbi:MAG: DNA primase [Anaerolineae bacterium]|nr:DNA primase [Anaerolineae bacterium]
MSAADDIKARLDIVTYVQQYVPLKRAGRTFKACCPFHNEKTPSFVVDPVRGTWRCYGSCATGGDVIGFAMKKHGWTFAEALQELARQTGVQLRARTPEEVRQSEREEGLRGLLRTAAEQYHTWLMQAPSLRAVVWKPNAEQALAYARGKRALTDDTLAKFQMGYAPSEWGVMTDFLKGMGYPEDDLVDAGVSIRNDNGRVYDRFRNRLMIPIRDERGRVVGFGARALAAEDNPKYLNSPQSVMFDKSKLLFGLDTAREAIRQTETVIIVEGYLDVIQAQQAGYLNVVAQMGTALTDAQLKKVAPRLAKRVILALDSDAAGQNATMRSLEVARRALSEDMAGRLQIDVRVLAVPGAKDPDDFIRESPEQWPAVVEQARPVADFVIDFETRDLASNASIMEREAAARRVLPLLLASERELYRLDNVQKLAGRLRIDEKTLMRWAANEAKTVLSAPKPVSPAPEAAPELPPRSIDDAPPLYDEYGAPIEEDIDIGWVPDAPPKPAAPAPVAQTGDVLERHCMSLLVEKPDRLHHVNRRLRELCQNDPRYRSVLRDLDAEDFDDAGLRLVWPLLVAALSQIDVDPQAYLDREADGGVRVVLADLRRTERERAVMRLKARMEGDALHSWQAHERARSGLFGGGDEEHILAALRLRSARLQREAEALQSLVYEAAIDEADPHRTLELVREAALLASAQGKIDAELKRRRL